MFHSVPQLLFVWQMFLTRSVDARILWSTGCRHTRQIPKGKPTTTSGTEAPLLPDALRDVPNETVKALFRCLFTTVIQDMKTPLGDVLFYVQKETLVFRMWSARGLYHLNSFLSVYWIRCSTMCWCNCSWQVIHIYNLINWICLLRMSIRHAQTLQFKGPLPVRCVASHKLRVSIPIRDNTSCWWLLCCLMLAPCFAWMCYTSVSKCTCHVDNHRRVCCTTNRITSYHCDQVTASE